MEVFLYPLEIQTKIQYFFMVSMRMEHTSSAPGFYRRIPHLLAIEVFAMAARAGSFSGAARELKITQSAVSRQVQQLERSLGATLFVRHKGGLRLTSDGEAILPVVDEVFGRLAKVCDSVRNASQVLTLRMPPTLATRWFLPLLPSLRGPLTDVDVRITTYDAWQPRFEDNDIDAAIVQGRGDWPNVEVTRLMPELLTPVCSPALAQKLNTPADLATLRLLHCDPLAAWGRWLDAAGLAGISARRGRRSIPWNSHCPPPHAARAWRSATLTSFAKVFVTESWLRPSSAYSTKESLIISSILHIGLICQRSARCANGCCMRPRNSPLKICTRTSTRPRGDG
jgi:LysR family glycine cleavage system transcriptional activator